jgi:hypothetical protein
MKAKRILITAALLLATTVSSEAGFTAYVTAPPGKTLVPPSADSVFSTIRPENSGAYIAVWDQTNSPSSVMERRDASNALVWQQVLTNSLGESTRLVLVGKGTVVWASGSCWTLLDQQTGAILRSGNWNFPTLDPRKLIVRSDAFYVQQGNQITGFNTNMDCIGTVTTALEEGRWDVVEGTWLIDRTARTNHILRVATLNDALQAVNIQEIPLLTSRAGGYVSHMPLGANGSMLVVASTLEWTPDTLQFFTMVTRDGEVLWQNTVSGSMHLTGSAVLTNGWLLSGIDFAKPETQNRQYLLVIDACGWPQPRQYYDPSLRWEFIVLNANSPRLLQSQDDGRLVLYNLVVTNWTPWWMDTTDPWSEFWIGPAFIPDTSTGYWSTPTSPPQ